MSAGAPSASDAIGLSRANLVRAVRLPRSRTASGVIPAHWPTVVRSRRANGYLSRGPMCRVSRLDARSRAHYVRSVIELIVDSMDTAAIARIRNAVVRWILIEPETIEHFRATMSGYRDRDRSRVLEERGLGRRKLRRVLYRASDGRRPVGGR